MYQKGSEDRTKEEVTGRQKKKVGGPSFLHLSRQSGAAKEREQKKREKRLYTSVNQAGEKIPLGKNGRGSEDVAQII